MKKHIFDKAKGPVIILAIHLCGTLSIKAVDMFNNNENVKLFALKPCCLPQMLYAKRGDIFRIGNHEFDAKDVCSNGSFNRKNWDGPPRWHLEVSNPFSSTVFVCSMLNDTLFCRTCLYSQSSICGLIACSRA
jgi:hypothetical protein